MCDDLKEDEVLYGRSPVDRQDGGCFVYGAVRMTLWARRDLATGGGLRGWS